MTPQEYRQAGFNVSLHIDTAFIERAEAAVWDNYIKPIAPSADKTTKQIKVAIMLLSYMFILQNSTVATCSGAKKKDNENGGASVDITRQLEELGKQACSVIDRLKERPDAVKGAECVDILGIYFKTNYFYL